MSSSGPPGGKMRKAVIFFAQKAIRVNSVGMGVVVSEGRPYYRSHGAITVGRIGKTRRGRGNAYRMDDGMDSLLVWR